MIFRNTLAAFALACVLPGTAAAQEWYAGGSLGWLQQGDSGNSGETGAFTTGNLGDGTTLDVAAGTPYGWETEFDNGFSAQGEVGMRFEGGLRAGV